MDPEQQRGRILRAGTGRQRQPGTHPLPVGGGRLDLGEGAGERGLRRRAAQWGRRHRRARGGRGGDVDPHRVRRGGVRGAQRVEGVAVGAELKVGEGGVVGGDPGDLVGGQVDPEDRGPAVVIGDDTERRPVPRPERAARPAVPVRGDLPPLPCRQLGHPEFEPRRPLGRGEGLAQVRHPPAVGRDHRSGEVRLRIVHQHPPLAAGDVDGDKRVVDPATPGRHPPGRDHRTTVGRDVGGLLRERGGGVGGEVVQVEAGLGPAGDGFAQVGVEPGGEQVRRGRAEVAVPVADRVGGVQDRGDLLLLALLAATLVVGGVGGTGQHVRGEQHHGRVRRGPQAAEPGRPGGDQPRLRTVGGEQPERGHRLLVAVGLFGIGARREKEQVARGGERGGGLPLGAAGQSPGRGVARRVDLPQRRAVPGAGGVEGRDRGDQAGAVRGERQPGRTRQREVGVEIVEGIACARFRHRTVLSPAGDIHRPARRPGSGAPRSALAEGGECRRSPGPTAAGGR